MKSCPRCHREYADETLNFCLDDGTWLLDGLSSRDETPTRLLAHKEGSVGNLPSERTRFIGRAKELSDCARLLTTNRLLTLTGFGGCGKTRLAIKTAENVVNDFEAGAWFVDLAPVTDEGMVIRAVARSFGVLEEPGKDLTGILVEYISTKRMIVVIDNCEHLLSACAELVDSLLNRCANLHIIATSREALNVEGEAVMALRPLSVPEKGQNDLSEARFDAVDLFIDRAGLVQSGFELTRDNFEVIADIGRRLDGIPLAIELAAARVKVLSVDQIRGMLSERFRLLSSAGKTVTPRHQTLQAAMHWSYDPLSDDEKRLLRLLSIFAGGWNLELAAEVSGCADEFEMLSLLTRLIDKSLVIVEDTGPRKRYSLLETVRQFAYELLVECGEAETVRKAHFKAMLALAERAYAERAVKEEEWANILESENANMRSALEFARERDPEQYLKLAGALGWFWMIRSHIFEGREHLTAALAATNPNPPRPARARALWGAANMLAWQGDTTDARQCMDEALRTWRDLDDTPEIAVSIEGIGWSQFFSGDDEAARDSFEECLRIQRAVGDPALVNRAMVGLAQILVALDRTDEARSMALDIIEYSGTHNDKRSEHFGWHYLADCALIEQDYNESLRLYKKSLELARTLGDKIEIAFEVQGIAMSLAGLDRPRDAIRLAGAVQAEMNRIGTNVHVRFWDALLEKHFGAAKGSLGDQEYRSAWHEGLAVRFDEAVAHSLVLGGDSF